MKKIFLYYFSAISFFYLKFLPIFTVTCPSLRRFNFISRCSNGNNQGSICEITCFPNQELVGNERIQCQSNGEWSPDVEGTRCRNRISKMP